MSRKTKDYNWSIEPGVNGWTWHQAHASIAMDIRDELKKLNLLLHCQNFQSIPHKLERIAVQTRKPRKRAKPKKRGGR